MADLLGLRRYHRLEDGVAVFEPTQSIRKQCTARRRDGQRCMAPALGAGEFCYAHDPDRARERAEARSKGGRNKATIIRLRGLVPPRLVTVYETLETALAEVHDGTLEPRQAMAMASLARAMVATLQVGELEQRVRDLESGNQERTRWG